jgi:hypothetical protein
VNADVISQSRDNELNTELLDAELPDERFVDDRYLHWLYDLNPLGAAYQEQVDEDGVRVAHYALIPQTYRNPDGLQRFVFSLNAVSRSTAQRKGYFGTLQLRVWSRARDGGVAAGIGVTNARSHRGVEIMGWRMAGQMPVQIAVPAPIRPKRWQSHAATADFVTSPTFAELADGLDEHPVEHWTHSWTPDYLRWRLSAPNGATFAIHASDDLLAVSTRSDFKGVPVAVIVKLLPRHGHGEKVSALPAITEACFFHRAPAAVYAGFNRFVTVRGMPAPERLKPAPLNLEICSLSDDIRQDSFALDTFEFLDMDAY